MHPSGTAAVCLNRRGFVASAVSATWLGAGCQPLSETAHIVGGFQGISQERGHLLRDGLRRPSGTAVPWPAPAATRRTRVVIAGGGVAGLAASRALRLRGLNDIALLELEEEAGGNARGATLAGMACPLGAHYLPLPGDDAPEVQALLEELGLRTRVSGRWQYDERHLCHSPQERLLFKGEWQDGLLPLADVGPGTLAQYSRFAALVESARRDAHWQVPVSNRPLEPMQRRLLAINFAAFLGQNGLTDVHLLWYLDYCCRDDYGAGLGTVSAWAGVHYFASRHGFHVPGRETVEREGLLTWPEGNAWLTRRMAAPLGERVHAGRLVVRIAQQRHGVEVDAFNVATQSMERWQAEHCIVALPVFVAAKVVENAPDFLRSAARQIRYAPWLVANLHLTSALHDRPGAAPSWDNVIYAEPGAARAAVHASGSVVPAAAQAHVGGGLGYVDAMHQSLRSSAGATVLTCYRALGDVPDGRRVLATRPFEAWRDDIVSELAEAHPDIAAKCQRMEIARYGHAMAIPLPRNENMSQIGFRSRWNMDILLQKKKQMLFTFSTGSGQRLHFAHSDWAGYSVFEEAFAQGHSAGLSV